MSCLCGDLYCWSCGPAQGNYHCPYCGKWSLDGGCDDPEACAQADKEYSELEAQYERDLEEYYKQMEREGD